MSELKERIAVAARELFLREGLEGFSMRKVADAAGVTAPAIYRHYENKDDLLNEIIDEGLAGLGRYLEPALSADTPHERLSRLIDRFLDFALEQPQYFDFAFMVPSRRIGRLSEELMGRNRVTFQIAVEQVAECVRQGIFKPGDPFEIAITIWAQAHGLITLHRMQRFGPDDGLFRGIYRKSIDLLLDGLRAPAKKP